MDFFGTASKFLELSPLPLFVIWLFTALFLFAPNAILKRSGMLDFSNNSRTWLGVGFCASMIFLIADLGVLVFRKADASLSDFFHRRLLRKRLNNLTIPEKNVLQQFTGGAIQIDGSVGMPERALWFFHDNTVPAGLVSAGLLSRDVDALPNQQGFPVTYVYHIDDYAWKVLNEQPGLIAIEM